mmetsp:Transcript_6615/g.16000  ORF Transcript_6615/g.16000 Transcript_6615/m.16000 type:complete len:211 (-) Transcript_6615:1286-1918(-)
MITVTYVPGNPGSNPGQRSSSVLTAARRPGTHSRSGERRERLAEAPRATHWAGESGTRHVRAIELLKKILTRAAVQRKALGSSPSFWRNGRRGRAGRVWRGRKSTGSAAARQSGQSGWTVRADSQGRAEQLGACASCAQQLTGATTRSRVSSRGRQRRQRTGAGSRRGVPARVCRQCAVATFWGGGSTERNRILLRAYLLAQLRARRRGA